MKHTLMILFASAVVACGQDYCWTNFAGSLVADDPFSSLYGIDINGAEDTLFVADRGSGMIRTVSIPDAVVTTVASPGDLTELVVNKVNGNVYFTAQGADLIKRLVPPYTNAGPTTIATGINSYALGVDSTTDTVYVSGQANGAIYYITNAGGATPGPLTLLAGIPGSPGFKDGALLNDAQFDAPMGIAVVGSGSTAILYLADRVNHAIRKIDVGAGTVTTVAGRNGPGCADGPGATMAQFEQPHNVVRGPDGNLYVSDQYNGTVRKVTLPDGDVTTIGGVCTCWGAVDGCGADAAFGQLGQITIDSAGNIYTADRAGVSSGLCGTAHARISKGTPPPAPAALNITSIQFVSGNVQIDFTSDPNDTFDLFTLQSSGTVDGTYGDVSATITQEGPPGSFRAVRAPSGDTQFYRIKK